jgi:hypothetical protein
MPLETATATIDYEAIAELERVCGQRSNQSVTKAAER